MTTAADSQKPRLFALLLGQDDPRKCTARKLVKFKLVRPIFRIGKVPSSSIVLDPFSTQTLFPRDKGPVENHGLVVIDCSWEKADETFSKRLPGQGRRLPKLLAGNPVNYGKLGKLSSVEALAAALGIVGFQEHAHRLLSAFSWGHTFEELNADPIKEYSAAESYSDIEKTESEFFGEN